MAAALATPNVLSTAPLSLRSKTLFVVVSGPASIDYIPAKGGSAQQLPSMATGAAFTLEPETVSKVYLDPSTSTAIVQFTEAVSFVAFPSVAAGSGSSSGAQGTNITLTNIGDHDAGIDVYVYEENEEVAPLPNTSNVTAFITIVIGDDPSTTPNPVSNIAIGLGDTADVAEANAGNGQDPAGIVFPVPTAVADTSPVIVFTASFLVVPGTYIYVNGNGANGQGVWFTVTLVLLP